MLISCLNMQFLSTTVGVRITRQNNFSLSSADTRRHENNFHMTFPAEHEIESEQSIINITGVTLCVMKNKWSEI